MIMANKQTLLLTLFVVALNTIPSNSFAPKTANLFNRDTIHQIRSAYYTTLPATATDNAGFEAKESEVEKLLRKARELRQEAEAAEEDLHSTLIEKKSSHDQEVDAAIAKLFPQQGPDEHVQHLVDRLHECQFSTSKLQDVVTRLHEREIAARGLKHVESKKHGDSGHVSFEVVSSPNESELHKVDGLVNTLIQAASLVDEEYWKKKRVQGEKLKLHHSDKIHWTTGNLASILKERAGFLGREHSEQFQKRMAEYYEAARRKDKKEDEKKSQKR